MSRARIELWKEAVNDSVHHTGPLNMPLIDFCNFVRVEVERAQSLFPGANVNTVALMEEVGELA